MTAPTPPAAEPHRVQIGPDGIDENGRPTYGGLHKWQPSQPPAARDAGVGELVDVIALALTLVPMGEVRVKAGIALATLAAAVQAERERADAAHDMAAGQASRAHDALVAYEDALRREAAADAAGYARAMAEVDAAFESIATTDLEDRTPSAHALVVIGIERSQWRDGSGWWSCDRDTTTHERPTAAILAAAAALAPNGLPPEVERAAIAAGKADRRATPALVHGGPPRDGLDDGR